MVAAAAREAAEESGVEGLVLRPGIIDMARAMISTPHRPGASAAQKGSADDDLRFCANGMIPSAEPKFLAVPNSQGPVGGHRAKRMVDVAGQG